MEGDHTALPVGDARPLAQDAVLLRAERQCDLERAVDVDENDVGAGADHLDVLHLQPGGRSPVTVRDA